MNRPRIVITGLGGICGLGNDVASIWDALSAGRHGIGPIDIPHGDELKIKVGAQIKSMPDHGLDRSRLITMDRFALLAVIAAGEALRQSGFVIDETNTRRVGAIIGTGVFGADTLDENYRAVLVDKKPRTAVFTVPRIMPGAPSGQVSMQYGIRGPVFGVTSACSTANHSIATAMDQLIAGRADVMLAGGTDASISFGVMKAWEALRVLAPEICRPFSVGRQGLVLGEGAGVAVLETLEHAQRRGATILAELAGVGMSADASDIVAPTVEGPRDAMLACLDDAGLAPGEIDYLNAHGTGTTANDRIETEAIKLAFGEHAYRLAISSTKSMHGHCLGASAAIELIACVKAMETGIVPPTANYLEKDPDCDLDVTPNTPGRRQIRAAMSNSFAFGGTNAVIAVKAV